MLTIKWASYEYIAYSTGKCLLQVKNGVIKMVLLFLRFNVKPVQMRVRGKPVIWFDF